MEVRNAQFTAFIDVLTTNTYVMVIVSDPTIRNVFTVPGPRPTCSLTLPLTHACWIQPHWRFSNGITQNRRRH